MSTASLGMEAQIERNTLKVVYDRLSDKISGENFTEVYYDEVSSMAHR